MQRRIVHLMLIVGLLLAWGAGLTEAQGQPPQAPDAAVGTAFTYQGYLEKAGSAVDDSCDFRFSLWDAASGGSQIGTTQEVSGIAVDDGYFTVAGLDFGAAAFAGDARYLEIAVRCTGDTDYTVLSGRVALTAAPYALYALAAPWSGLSGVPAGFADGVDDDTTYTAGTGLDLTGTQFGITAAYRLPQSCADGQIAEWNSATGTWTCGNDDTGSGGGGDITAVGAGIGLEGGGATGAVTLTLATAYRLPQGCGAGAIAEWNAATGQWNCGTDDVGSGGGGGDITGVYPGTGLSGGGSSGEVTLTVLFGGTGTATTVARSDHTHDDRYYTESELQTSGSAQVHWGNLTNVPAGFADGTDNDTIYSAGTGLDLSGTTFSVATGYRLPQSCANGAIPEWNSTTSSWDCGVDDDEDTTYSAGTGLDLTGTTFSVDVTYQLPQSCANGQVAKWDSATSQWICAADEDDDTTYTAGPGLDLSGTTFSVNTAYRLPQLCGNGEIPEWNSTTSSWDCGVDDDHNTTYTAGTGMMLVGTTFAISNPYRLPQNCLDGQIAEWSSATGDWSCGADDDSGGDITAVNAGTGLSGGAVSGDASLEIATAYRLPQSCTNGQIAKWNAVTLVWECGDDNTGTATYWALTGNAGTNPTSNFLGTTDNQPLEMRVNNARVLRLEPHWTSPNIIGGYSGNSVSAGVYGAFIGGGGASGAINQITANYATVGGGYSNTVTATYGTVGGGEGNTVRGADATIGGGSGNVANGVGATVGGGWGNVASGDKASVSGGYDNHASGMRAAIGGGDNNIASGEIAVISGGWDNRATITGTVIGGGASNMITGTAQYGTIAGGYNITVTGRYAAVGGGYDNEASAVFATIGGGYDNEASDDDATVSGGWRNTASGKESTVGGGSSNTASAWAATVGGGAFNIASGAGAFIGGGGHLEGFIAYGNTAAGVGAVIGGGWSNTATVTGTVIGGGYSNLAGGDYAVIGGGYEITATAAYAAAGGGKYNAVTGMAGTVGGGQYNRVLGSSGAIGGGYSNLAGGDYAAIGGGYEITTTAAYAAAGGGKYNAVTGMAGTVGGGQYNRVLGSSGAIGGGSSNQALSAMATIGGGQGNVASGIWSTVGGGISNEAAGEDAFIGGGWSNYADGEDAAIAGGYDNTASGYRAFIGSGWSNQATVTGTVIGGGYSNLADDEYAVIGGGYNITVTGGYAAVVGGGFNTAGGDYAIVGGGMSNTGSGHAAFIGGGEGNTASFYYATVGGGHNNTASSWGATVPGGESNQAAGDYAFAAGRQAKANSAGCFVWGDSTAADVSCATANRTIFRSSGGFYIYTNGTLSSGAYLAAGSGSWTSLSDRSRKENFEAVDTQLLLERLAAVPITTWNYKSQDPSIRHIGPMAQDFNALLPDLGGEGETYISTIDADGVALAAIQGLYAQNQAQSARIEALEAENAGLHEQLATQQAQLDDLAARVEALEANPPLFPTDAAFAPGRAWFLGLALLGLVAFGLMRRREGGKR